MLKIETCKDLLIICICIAWLIGNIIEFLITKDVIINNIGFITIMIVLILIKNNSKKFNNWLNSRVS